MNKQETEYEIRFLINSFDKRDYKHSSIHQYYYPDGQIDRSTGMLNIIIDEQTFSIKVPGDVNRIPDSLCVRQRVVDGKNILTLKGPKRNGVGYEKEWEISQCVLPVKSQSKTITHLSKIRYYVDKGDYTIEVDVFQDELSGLIIAEIENPPESFIKPDWFGLDITDDFSYSNQVLSSRFSI